MGAFFRGIMSKRFLISLIFLTLVGAGFFGTSHLFTQGGNYPIRKIFAEFAIQHSKSDTAAIQIKTHVHNEIEIRKKLKILDEIFQSKNDNDPRLDLEFNQISQETKEALEKKYNELHLESRNERGTIVFLVGKSLSSEKDFQFLRQVLAEAPCLSLSDCTSNLSHPTQDRNSHLGSVNEITLEYPQIVALKSIETYLANHSPDPPLMQIVREASHSKSPIVSHMATSLEHQLLKDKDMRLFI